MAAFLVEAVIRSAQMEARTHQVATVLFECQ